jgi:aminomethyltransferase
MTSATTETPLLRTPFHQYHLDRGGKMVPFAGWEMPIRYGSIIDEHHQVRRSGGLFDVSHMGRLRFTGRDARAFLDHICTRQVWGMKDGQVRYSLVCNEQGGCRDDVLVYRLGDAEYVMVCNASNRAKLLDHFERVRGPMVFKLKDETESTAMVAIQGPKVMGLIGGFSSSIPELKRYTFVEKNLLIAKVMISRTGYTGEDGVEVILPASLANKAVDMLLKNVNAEDIKPCGLGARDSLRLEAGMPLYGHEIEEHLDPVSAGLHFAIKLDKAENAENSPKEVGRFIGQDALQRIAREGPRRKLVGLALEGKRAARQGMKVMHGANDVGFVTSGCWSPTLEKSIAMAYVDANLAAPGTSVSVDPEKLNVPASVCAIPFYKSS